MSLRITNRGDEQQFYGHGKLLITGEYFVLDGARALAVPTRLGQTLRVKKLQALDSTLYWVALNNKKKAWLNLAFDTVTLECINAQTPEALRLSQILKTARQLNPAFLSEGHDVAVETHLEFPNEWGLGSSSTLIYCVAQWAQVDGYTLLQQTLGGSGYDVACAGYDVPIIYQLQNGKPQTIKTNWLPAFYQQLYFVYTGQKQLSSEGIKKYKSEAENKLQTLEQLNRITDAMMNTAELIEFENLIRQHESLIGAALRQMKIADTVFADYWGAVKSLGAWGGDFVLMTNNRSEDELKAYLNEKSISIAFSWKDLILSNNL